MRCAGAAVAASVGHGFSSAICAVTKVAKHTHPRCGAWHAAATQKRPARHVPINTARTPASQPAIQVAATKSWRRVNV
jgi:hypothetical protein